ncbi:hypothetical protein WJX79_004888 [Trebouxia sp. C0005]
MALPNSLSLTGIRTSVKAESLDSLCLSKRWRTTATLSGALGIWQLFALKPSPSSIPSCVVGPGRDEAFAVSCSTAA